MSLENQASIWALQVLNPKSYHTKNIIIMGFVTLVMAWDKLQDYWNIHFFSESDVSWFSRGFPV